MCQTGISKISEKEIKIKYHGNDQIDIIVVDLPGIINSGQGRTETRNQELGAHAVIAAPEEYSANERIMNSTSDSNTSHRQNSPTKTSWKRLGKWNIGHISISSTQLGK
jgi:hypothetical protein